ncbi:MAG: hypothetical protein Q4C80_02930 [Bacillota bacterium]|nr:hypothetical protein [Bacillota bacterium]
MKTNKSKAAVFFIIIAALFLIYGIYAVGNAVQYIDTYTTSATNSLIGKVHYIITSSMAYFGFAAVLVIASLILNNQAKIISTGMSYAEKAEMKSVAGSGNTVKSINSASVAPVVSTSTAVKSEDVHEDDEDIHEMPATSGAVKYVPDEPVETPASPSVSEPKPVAAKPIAKQAEVQPEPVITEPVRKPVKYPDTVPLPEALTAAIERDFKKLLIG